MAQYLSLLHEGMLDIGLLLRVEREERLHLKIQVQESVQHLNFCNHKTPMLSLLVFLNFEVQLIESVEIV